MVRSMVTTVLLICPPVLVASFVAGITLALYGAVKRKNSVFSLGLMLAGTPVAFAGFLLGSMVGWEAGDGLTGSQEFGRALLFVIGGVGAGFAVLGLIGTWRKGFFWESHREGD